MKKENLFLTLIANKFKNNSICKIYATIDNNEAFKNKEVFINENEIFSIKEIIISKRLITLIMTNHLGAKFNYMIFGMDSFETTIKLLFHNRNINMYEVYNALFYVNKNKIDFNTNSILATPAIIDGIRTEIIFMNDNKTIGKTNKPYVSSRTRRAMEKEQEKNIKELCEKEQKGDWEKFWEEFEQEQKEEKEKEMIEQLESELYGEEQ